jgi:hypothetical protein
MRFFAILLLLGGLSSGCNSKSPEIQAKEAANEEALAKQAAAGTADSKALAEAAAATAAPTPCNYTITKLIPGWTAYKTTQKVAVGGTFNSVKLSEMKPGGTLTAAFTGLSAEIEGASIESGNPARNATVAAAFFAKFAEQAKITAQITGASGDEKLGLFMINVTMNNVTRSLQLRHEGMKDGTLVAKTVINMLDFGLQGAFDSIHKTCEALHTGDDGVSKTWTEVELSITADVTKKCS